MGNTTVANLLLRFLTRGLAGRRSRSERLAGTASKAPGRPPWPGQESHRFTASIRDNARLACPDASDLEAEPALRRGRARAAAPVLALDEPTALLDPDTASELIADAFAAAREQSVLRITRRTEGLELADWVVSLAPRESRVRFVR